MRATPAKADAGISNRVPLHLVDGHFSRVTLDELDEATAFSRWNFDVGDLAEALEERAELILGNVARESTDEDSRIVGVGELIHRLWLSVEANGTAAAALAHAAHRIDTAHRALLTRHTAHTSTLMHTTRAVSLGCSGRDAHRTIAAIDALHFAESALLVLLIGEADKAVTTRNTRDGIGHDLGTLARWKAVLE